MTAARDPQSFTSKALNGESRVSIVHDRVHETITDGRSRFPFTLQWKLDDGAEHFRRVVDLIAKKQAALVAEAQAARANNEGDA